MSIDELCAAACSHQTKMADALLVACVQHALETQHALDLREEDIDRYLAIVTAQQQ